MDLTCHFGERVREDGGPVGGLGGGGGGVGANLDHVRLELADALVGVVNRTLWRRCGGRRGRRGRRGPRLDELRLELRDGALMRADRDRRGGDLRRGALVQLLERLVLGRLRLHLLRKRRLTRHERGDLGDLGVEAGLQLDRPLRLDAEVLGVEVAQPRDGGHLRAHAGLAAPRHPELGAQRDDARVRRCSFAGERGVSSRDAVLGRDELVGGALQLDVHVVHHRRQPQDLGRGRVGKPAGEVAGLERPRPRPRVDESDWTRRLLVRPHRGQGEPEARPVDRRGSDGSRSGRAGVQRKGHLRVRGGLGRGVGGPVHAPQRGRRDARAADVGARIAAPPRGREQAPETEARRLRRGVARSHAHPAPCSYSTDPPVYALCWARLCVCVCRLSHTLWLLHDARRRPGQPSVGIVGLVALFPPMPTLSLSLRPPLFPPHVSQFKLCRYQKSSWAHSGMDRLTTQKRPAVSSAASESGASVLSTGSPIRAQFGSESMSKMHCWRFSDCTLASLLGYLAM